MGKVPVGGAAELIKLRGCRKPVPTNGRVMYLYLAGKIPKGSEIGRISDWRKEYVAAISAVCDAQFVSPEDPTLDESQPELVFGHDCHLVRLCDVVIVNAASKLGVGTAQEMLIAKYYEKRVLTVLPPDTHHRRTDLVMHGHVVPDWIHPFIFSTSDAIFDSLPALCEAIRSAPAEVLRGDAKTMNIVDAAIEKYLASAHATASGG